MQRICCSDVLKTRDNPIPLEAHDHSFLHSTPKRVAAVAVRCVTHIPVMQCKVLIASFDSNDLLLSHC